MKSLLFLMASGSGPASLEGKWFLTAFTIGDQDFLASMNEAAAKMDKPKKVEDQMPYYEFFADGTVKVVDPSENDESVTFTYKLDDKKLSIDMEGNLFEAIVEGNTFTYTAVQDGKDSAMVYTKK